LVVAGQLACVHPLRGNHAIGLAQLGALLGIKSSSLNAAGGKRGGEGETEFFAG
jgi:hypothetical protein